MVTRLIVVLGMCMFVFQNSHAGVIKVDPLVRYQEYYGVGVTNEADYSGLINGYGMGVNSTPAGKSTGSMVK